MAKLKNANIFQIFEKHFSFKCHNRHKISTKRGRLRCDTSESQMGLSLIRLSHETTKDDKIIKTGRSQNFTILNHSVQGSTFMRCHLQELQNITWFSSETQCVFPIKGHIEMTKNPKSEQ